MSNFGSTLFLVASPFQCLNMLEAINHFRIDDYDILVTYSDTCSLKLIDNVLSEHHFNYSIAKAAHIIYDLLPILFKKKRKYKNIFIGDYYSEINETLANFYAERKYNIYYLDDGSQALTIFSDNPRPRYTDKKVKFVLGLYSLVGLFKQKVSLNFFTFYNVKSGKISIIRNNLTSLKSSISVRPDDLYIIGANSSVLNFKGHKYIEYLDGIIRNYSRDLYGAIFYCPHRRDTNNGVIKDWCLKNDIQLFDTQVSVEYDFVKKKINPKCVLGFTSNALYTLHIIYPDAEINTIYYELESEYSNNETQMIRGKMNAEGIKTIKAIE